MRTIALHNAARFDDLWLRAVDAHEAGGPPLCMQTSKAGAEDRGAAVRKRRPELRVLVITSDNASDPNIAALLAEPWRITSEFDVIIFSPAVRSGVSITGAVQCVFVDAFASRVRGETPSCASVLQSIGRFRHSIDSVVRAFVAAHEGNAYTTDPTELQAIACSEARSGEALVSLDAIAWAWTREDTREPEADIDGLLLDRWTMREAQTRCEANDRIAELARLAYGHGWTVEDHRGELVDAARAAELRTSAKEARALLVVEHRAAIRGEAPRTRKQEAEASELVGFYGVEAGALTDEQIGGGPQLRNGLRDLITVRSVAVARYLDREDRARLLGSALDAAGLHPVNGGTFDREAFAAWLGRGGQGDRLRAILGTAERRPGELMGKLVKHLGGSKRRPDKRWIVDFRGSWTLADHARSTLTAEAMKAAKGFAA